MVSCTTFIHILHCQAPTPRRGSFPAFLPYLFTTSTAKRKKQKGCWLSRQLTPSSLTSSLIYFISSQD